MNTIRRLRLLEEIDERCGIMGGWAAYDQLPYPTPLRWRGWQHRHHGATFAAARLHGLVEERCADIVINGRTFTAPDAVRLTDAGREELHRLRAAWGRR